MVLTDRDNKLLELINKFKIIDVPRAAKLVKEYPNEYIARRRLRQMVNAKLLNHSRSYIGQSYIFFKKPVKQIEHRLLLLDFYSLLSSMCNILEFETEYKLKGTPGIRRKGDVISDAYMALQRNDGKKASFVVEVQQPFNPFNLEKYKGIDTPTIILITDKKIDTVGCDVIIIDTKLKNIKEVLN